ncbi:unnamed protein product [Rhizoctonia solani]|uniref:Uncharacterized protein n=1 Tax=Rhizoctonia solani TaxID=456999 RepID=A0A8H3D3C1_9AGAM|nr:unnamed protein product [Rhizoctonia solani]
MKRKCEDKEKPQTKPGVPAVVEWNAFTQDHYESGETSEGTVWSGFTYPCFKPPTVNDPVPNLTNGVEETPQPTINGQVNGHMDADKPEIRIYKPSSNPTQPHIVEFSAPANPGLPDSNLAWTDPPPDTFLHETRKLLTLIAILASDVARASSEKLAIANAVYHSVRLNYSKISPANAGGTWAATLQLSTA